jgi:hypothetical protein
LVATLSEEEGEPPSGLAVKKKNNNKKYHDTAYDDKTIEGLMNYFKCETYPELCQFLQHIKQH